MTLVLLLLLGCFFLLIWPLKICADSLTSNNFHL